MGTRKDDRHRPLVARFTKYCDREAVLRNASKLRGTRIFINEDLCPASQAVKKEKLLQLIQARREEKIAYFSHTRLIIKERLGPYNKNTSEDASNTSAGSRYGGGGADVGVGEGSGSTSVWSVTNRGAQTPAPSRDSSAAGDGACGVVPSAAGDNKDAGASGAAALLSGNSGHTTLSSKDQTKYKIDTRSQNK